MDRSVTIKPFGDSALMVIFEQRIDEQINRRVMALEQALEQEKWVLECVPAFASCMVYYDPMKYAYAQMEQRIRNVLSRELTEKADDSRIIAIPVCYGGEYGEDLSFVAKHAGLTEAETIALHSGTDYRIYMLGFLPGFPYLGGLDPRLETPRLTSPRVRIPAGSVGIGGKQTGIYPMESPGGWQLIGRTPISLFRRSQNGQPAEPIFRAGDRLRFRPISEEDFLRIWREQHGD